MAFALYVCFFFSGAAGLLYEIYWAQRFSLLLGLDVYSHAAVLTAFMGGLAIGSHLAGRWADNLRRPWVAYGILELAIGVCGAAIPYTLGLLHDPLAWLYRATDHAVGPMTLFRFLAAVIVLSIPTGLMGATLPVMALALRTQKDRLGDVVGRLYAMNTIGAVFGIVAGGFILGEWIGLLNTNFVAVALNVLAAITAFAFGAKPTVEPAAAPPNDSVQPVPSPAFAVDTSLPGSPTIIALGAGLTGAAAMMTQIGWIRALSASVGSSTYAFTLIVAVFLVGIAIGARLAAVLIAKWRDAAIPWAYSCLAAAALCFVVMFPLGELPVWTKSILDNVLRRQFWPVPAVWLLLGTVSLVILIAPTIAMGTTFPLACEAYAQRRSRGTARVTGSVYAINTIGAMLGSALGGLVCIGLFGVQGTLRLAAVLYACTVFFAFVVIRIEDRKRFVTGAAQFAVAILVCWFAAGATWSRDKMISAPFTLRHSVPGQRITWYRESAEATIAILEFPPPPPDCRVLMINGKPDGGNTGDRATMVLLGQLPMMLHGDAKDIALIGLGAGITLKSVLTHDVKSVDMIELSKAVVDAVHPPDGSPGPFDAVNGRTLEDKRVNLIIGDGRNHISLTDKKYDVILSQPSNPWVAGVSSLFTREYFESCKQHLNNEGILCQWLHSYDLQPMEFFRILRTIHEVFDETTLWISPGGVDYFVIAPMKTKPVLDQLERVWQREPVKKDLADVALRRPADLLGLHMYRLDDVMGINIGKDVGIPRDIPANTDDHNRLRYAAARAIWQPHASGTYVSTGEMRSPPGSWLGAYVPIALTAEIEDMQDLMFLMILADELREPSFRWIVSESMTSLGFDTFRTRELTTDAGEPRRAPAGLDENRPTIAQSMLASARRQIELATSNPDPGQTRRHWRTARMYLHAALTATPNDGEALVAMAEVQLRLQRLDEARQTLRKAKGTGARIPPGLSRELNVP